MKIILKIAGLLFVLALLNPAASSYAGVLSGTGWGRTLGEAKKQALGDLCEAIFVQVESRFSAIETEVDDKISRDVTSVLELTSELPILGAEFKNPAFKMDGGVQVTALLNSNKAGPLYKARLLEIRKEAADALAAAEKADSQTVRHRILTEAAALFEQYSRLKFVARSLGNQSIADLPISKNELCRRILILEKRADSIDFAARLITRALPRNLSGIYVYPPMIRGSNEVTPFAAVVRECVAERLKTVDSPDRADYLMTGRYEKSDQGIDLSYTLYKLQGNAINGAVVRLTQKAFSGYATDPKTLSLDRLLQEGMAVSNDFRVALKTDFGSEHLLFEKGKKIELFVKSNRTAYFYIVGHIDKGKEQRCSYLLHLQKAEGNRRFIRFINGDDANKWISLGRFKTAPPFGVENLHMVAATEDPIDKLPPAHYDPGTKLYLIADNPERGVAITRALILDEEETRPATEAVLTFTTMGAMGEKRDP